MRPASVPPAPSNCIGGARGSTKSPGSVRACGGLSNAGARTLCIKTSSPRLSGVLISSPRTSIKAAVLPVSKSASPSEVIPCEERALLVVASVTTIIQAQQINPSTPGPTTM